MIKQKRLAGKPLAWLLTLVYFASYVTRINYAAVIQEIVTDTGFAKSQLSVVLVAVSITYGIGQIINGRIGDLIRPQKLILIGLISATAINLIFPFVSFSPIAMCLLWGLNGFAQAMLWPAMVKILVSNTNDAMYGYSVVRISWGSSFGTIAIYLTAPLIISLVGWKGVFAVSTLIGAAVTALWVACMRQIDVPSETLTEEKTSQEPAGFHFPKQAIFPIIFIALGIIFQGMLRDGVTSWMPTYLSEVFHFANESSIFWTVTLAIFSIVTFGVVGAIYQKYFQSEVACGTLVFALATVGAVAMYFLYNGGAVIAIALMTLITGCMHGVNLMLITHVPKQFRRYGNISTISGAINSCTYIGAAISTYGIAWLSEVIGWRNTVGIWAIIALLGTLCCLIAIRPWRRFCQK